AARSETAGQVRLREAGFEDHPQIALLESRYGLESKSYEDWRHLWLGNPLYREMQPGWPIGWVLEDENGRIVGSMSNIPLPYEFEGTRVLAATGRAWAAEPAFRSASLLLLEHLIHQDRIDVYVNNTVSAEASAAVDALDCSPVPVGQWNEAAFWITNHQGFFEDILVRKCGALAKPLSYPIAAAACLKDWLTGKNPREGNVEVQSC